MKKIRMREKSIPPKNNRAGGHRLRPAVLRRILIIFCGLIVGVNVYLANARNILGNQLPMPFGVGAAVVLSGSMEPTLSVGDLIFVTEREIYEVGDVVVFQDGQDLVVHRIIAVQDTVVQTQGDANNAADSPIDISLVKGKVLFHLPWIGRVVQLLKTPVGIILLLTAAVLLWELSYRKEREKDTEQLEEIKAEIRRLRAEQDEK